MLISQPTYFQHNLVVNSLRTKRATALTRLLCHWSVVTVRLCALEVSAGLSLICLLLLYDLILGSRQLRF